MSSQKDDEYGFISRIAMERADVERFDKEFVDIGLIGRASDAVHIDAGKSRHTLVADDASHRRFPAHGPARRDSLCHAGMCRGFLVARHTLRLGASLGLPCFDSTVTPRKC
jgi:hypothetical protein